MPVTSTESLVTFKHAAWRALEDLRLRGADFSGRNIQHLRTGMTAVYQVYSSTLPDDVPAKVPQTGHTLRTSMEAIFTTLGDRLTAMQHGMWPRVDNTAYLAEYQKPMGQDLGEDVEVATKKYLHVYPDGTLFGWGGNVRLPDARTSFEGQDWRIGINAMPASMNAVLAAILPIMDAQDCIQHIKFTPPGLTGKPDALIIYMKKGADYATVRDGVLGAMDDDGINLQPCFNLLWNELIDGVAEAAEPPRGGYSFGAYRSVIAFLYYFVTLKRYGRVYEDVFELFLDNTYGNFGIPLGNPHEQRSALGDWLHGNNLRLYAQLMSVFVDGDPAHAGNYQLPTI